MYYPYTMKVKGRFDHFNINVTQLERSLEFYQKALGLHETSRKEAADGSFILVYLLIAEHLDLLSLPKLIILLI